MAQPSTRRKVARQFGAGPMRQPTGRIELDDHPVPRSVRCPLRHGFSRGRHPPQVTVCRGLGAVCKPKLFIRSRSVDRAQTERARGSPSDLELSLAAALEREQEIERSRSPHARIGQRDLARPGSDRSLDAGGILPSDRERHQVGEQADA